jgi:hypothetical protein
LGQKKAFDTGKVRCGLRSENRMPKADARKHKTRSCKPRVPVRSAQPRKETDTGLDPGKGAESNDCVPPPATGQNRSKKFKPIKKALQQGLFLWQVVCESAFY